MKHSIPGALVTKTRGTYTVAPEGWNGQSVVLAKAGYMTPEEAQTLTEIEQCRVWIERYRERNFETKMRSKSLTSLRQQHLFEVDLQSVKRDVRWNADYDMKRKLVKVRDVDGLITADTVPWRTIDEFEQARDLLEDWKRSQRRVLKTKQDYDDMIAWGAARSKPEKDRHPCTQRTLARRGGRPQASSSPHRRHRDRSRKPDMAEGRAPQAQRPNGKVDDGAVRGEGHRDERQGRQAARCRTRRPCRIVSHLSRTTTEGS